MPRLSIVVAAYRMQREVPRTLRSFLPPLQRAVEEVDYEIVVVDNGSPTALDLRDLAGGERGGPPRSVRLVRIAPEEARASPVTAINDAIRDHATGDLLMVCIDGARMASSHLVRRAVDVLTGHPTAFTFAGSRHLGPKPQMQSVREGYDQAAEDALLGSVPWEEDLDWLHAVSVRAGAHHDPGNPLLQNETNALAVARATWNAVGGYDEGFARPGGGLCNLELFSRYVRRPGALNVLLLGEATFHQVHGGASTSHDAYFDDSLGEHAEVTGQRYRPPSYPFLADLGEHHDRLSAVGGYALGKVSGRSRSGTSAPPG